ncbi:transglycosylase SLT domain-containing protein [Shewanella waksmanii]|uniref:transglycosylase SLT domain-containing protein n=1 Tax=Shewanella waksmanii TaxID=213783 RepID=UPI0037356BCD
MRKLLFAYLCPLVLCLSMASFTSKAANDNLSVEQQRYLDARSALDERQLSTYRKLRAQLDDYPLVPYLDFHANIDSILKMKGKQAASAIEAFSGTPLYNSARYRYLQRAGSQRRWQDFLAVSPQTPRNKVLQCYYYRAQVKPNPDIAFEGAEKLWLHGRSQPKECDPLFHQWEKAGLRTQELVWSRMLLAFNAGQTSLLKYLSRKITRHKEPAKRLLAVYKDSRSLRHKSRFMKQAKINADIVDAGLRRLAKKDVAQAVTLFVAYQKADRFTDYQGRQLGRYLIRRAIIKQEDGLQSLVDEMLPLLDSDDLVILRIRWALRQNQLNQVADFIDLLSPETQQKARWQYWSHRLSKQPNSLSQLQQQRNFYGFTAAHINQQAFNMAHNETQANAAIQATLSDDAGLSRVTELMAIDKTIDARAEWLMLLGRHDQATQAQYGLLAVNQQWHDLAVQASIKAKAWNDMTMRFPMVETRLFEQNADKRRVDVDDLRAIARRESAYYPYATSGVGARGLMQLMPATAKDTAKRHKLTYKGQRSLYQAKINIPLGSAYYAQLLKQFDGNRILAAAAYNAGPHRVKSWLKKSDGQLDVMSFIESIPFTETREYVQALLSYRVIYQLKQGKPAQLFTDEEWQMKY